MIGHVKHFDSNKAMSFKVIDKGLLKRYIKIWEIISNLILVKNLTVNLVMAITINT